MTLSLSQMEEARRALDTPLFAGLPGDIGVSFEFFPPKTEKMEAQLWDAVQTLAPLGPRFVSVTYGAGGSTRERTHATVARIQRETSLAAAAHLTCVEASRAEIDAVAPPLYPEEMREILDDLVKDNHRASEVLRKIRTLVRQGDPEIEPLSVATLVEDVALLVHSDAIVRGMRMTMDIPADLPLVAGDKIQLQQVVLNLVLNAFEAMSARPPPDRLVSIRAQLDKVNMIRIAVRDRGCGFPAKTLATLFTPYVSSKREGLGLGLCISRSIIEMHGGRLWAEQNTDLGATIYLTVPSVAADNLRT